MRAVWLSSRRGVLIAAVWGLSLLPATAPADPAVAGAEPRKAVRDADVARKATTVAVIRLTGDIPDGVGQGGLLADVAPHLHRIVERLDKAAEDNRVKAVVLAVESPEVGRARLDELRGAIARIRKAGKPVAAHLVGGSPAHYMLAASCDTITMAPAATLEIAGVRTEMMFFKSLLDRLDVAAEILQVGEFKGAGEPLTRESMSPQLREQYESFVGDLYDQLVERVAADRRLPVARIRELVDTGIFTAEAALEAGLVDAVGYEDEVVAAVATRAGVASPKVVRDYAERTIDQDFTGLGGLVKLVEVLSGRAGEKPAGTGKRVAIVHVTGTIREGKGRDDLLAGGAAGAEDLAKAIRTADKDDAVVAIVLRIDSPGGSALASDLIWREVERCGKPVVASLSDTAASGGYYIAVAADRIVAAPGTLTGSIGVVGGKIAVGGALEKVGVHTDVVSKGRNAGWLSTTEPFTPGERAAFRATMEEIYRLFTGKVAAGRKLDAPTVENLAGGRVFTGRQAHAAGLVDRLGTLDDAVDEARKLAGLDAAEKTDRILLPEPRGLFDDLLGAVPGAADPVAHVAAGGGLRVALLARLVGVAALEPLANEVDVLTDVLCGRPQLLLPARITIR